MLKRLFIYLRSFAFFLFQELGNNILEKSKNNEKLQEILTPATIMVVSVTASTTQGLVPIVLSTWELMFFPVSFSPSPW